MIHLASYLSMLHSEVSEPPADSSGPLVALLWFFGISRDEFFIGFIAAFILSPLSHIPFRVRYRLTLVFTVGEFFYSFIYFSHYAWEVLYMAVTEAFGFTFALARVRVTPRYASPAGWIFLVLHGSLLVLYGLALISDVRSPSIYP